MDNIDIMTIINKTYDDLENHGFSKSLKRRVIRDAYASHEDMRDTNFFKRCQRTAAAIKKKE